ncbi:GIY-YIG nuclease family protein [bacterium LRH843]|nr:GIY-YIG nuclease family protein [bacterium LRH843]
MDRRKQLKQHFKEITVEAGVYQIKNNKNGKIFIGSTRNIKSLNGVTFSLENNVHNNKSLQAEWNEFGKDAFSIDIVEILKKKDDPYFNEKKALAELESKWLDQIQPFGDKGFNIKKLSFN